MVWWKKDLSDLLLTHFQHQQYLVCLWVCFCCKAACFTSNKQINAVVPKCCLQSPLFWMGIVLTTRHPPCRHIQSYGYKATHCVTKKKTEQIKSMWHAAPLQQVCAPPTLRTTGTTDTFKGWNRRERGSAISSVVGMLMWGSVGFRMVVRVWVSVGLAPTSFSTVRLY